MEATSRWSFTYFAIGSLSSPHSPFLQLLLPLSLMQTCCSKWTSDLESLGYRLLQALGKTPCLKRTI
jgi:hypothetical protein